MPILFTVNQDKGYFTARYVGTITEEDVLRENALFLSSGEWHPGLNALVDLSEADLSVAHNPVIKRVAQYFENVLRANHANSVKTAIYAPSDFPYAIARIYEVMTEQSPQTVQVYREISEAKTWLEDHLESPE
ncbi:MAG: hypothetical protein KKF30_13795 [Proteobacteria bacterium]|nr:hypothetical protein [Pseudomonadota bacterium]MBU4471172.1 hypothetical protein [Pseudomonadota bacterium]MCG2753147.1 hypothetical protein [Desulfobacteraceae bacterium]